MAAHKLRALMVYKKSSFQLYAVERRNQQVTELISKKDPSVAALRSSHASNIASIAETHACLKDAGFKVTRTYRAKLGQVTGFDLIVAVGGDGTLLDVSHHLQTVVPLLGVNSDPKHSVGMLAAAQLRTLPRILRAIARGQLRPVEVTRLKLILNDRAIDTLALNDVLVAHSNPAATSRYLLRVGRHTERQKSSGLWLSTAVGSTAAIRSAGGAVQPVSDDQLQYRVREPYTAKKPVRLASGLVTSRSVVKIHSAMRGGRIYVDGPHIRFAFGLGDRLEVQACARSLPLYLSESNLNRRAALASLD